MPRPLVSTSRERSVRLSVRSVADANANVPLNVSNAVPEPAGASFEGLPTRGRTGAGEMAGNAASRARALEQIHDIEIGQGAGQSKDGRVVASVGIKPPFERAAKQEEAERVHRQDRKSTL